MRRLNGLITALLVILCAAGVTAAVLFLQQEKEAAELRQEKVSELSEKLQPISDGRREWQDKENEWQAQLAEGAKGRTCILLGFDNMSENLYETMFDMADQYGFRATFAFRNGRIPDWEEGYVTPEELQEMLDAGWEYAVSVGDEQIIYEDEDGTVWTGSAAEDARREDETDDGYGTAEEAGTGNETETETETETERPKNWLVLLDEAVENLELGGLSVPKTVFCTAEQYAETTDSDLARKGFQMAGVLNGEDFPLIDAQEGKLCRIDCGVYNQRDQNVEKVIGEAVANGDSVALMMNEIVRISRDAEYDLSLTKYGSLLNYLKSLEEQGLASVMTYSEYYQYLQEQQMEQDELKAQYAAFRREMSDALAALDERESEIVEEVRSTEAPQKSGIEEIIDKVLHRGGSEQTADETSLQTESIPADDGTEAAAEGQE